MGFWTLILIWQYGVAACPAEKLVDPERQIRRQLDEETQKRQGQVDQFFAELYELEENYLQLVFREPAFLDQLKELIEELQQQPKLVRRYFNYSSKPRKDLALSKEEKQILEQRIRKIESIIKVLDRPEPRFAILPSLLHQAALSRHWWSVHFFEPIIQKKTATAAAFTESERYRELLNEIALAYGLLALKMAKRYERRFKLSEGSLISSAFLGIKKAALRYDETRGSFYKYSEYWARAQIGASLKQIVRSRNELTPAFEDRFFRVEKENRSSALSEELLGFIEKTLTPEEQEVLLRSLGQFFNLSGQPMTDLQISEVMQINGRKITREGIRQLRHRIYQKLRIAMFLKRNDALSPLERQWLQWKWGIKDPRLDIAQIKRRTKKIFGFDFSNDQIRQHIAEVEQEIEESFRN